MSRRTPRDLAAQAEVIARDMRDLWHAWLRDGLRPDSPAAEPYQYAEQRMRLVLRCLADMAEAAAIPGVDALEVSGEAEVEALEGARRVG